MTNPSPGQTAYEAYRKQSGGVSLVSRAPLPEWAALQPAIRAAWAAAERAVIDLTERGILHYG
jgi:hypothetical protein